MIFQKALVEREINEIIQGIHIQRRKNVQTEEIALDEKDKLAAKSIDEEDVCPICQEELLDCKEPLTYCKYVKFYFVRFNFTLFPLNCTFFVCIFISLFSASAYAC